jgi:OmcA/MtrC family decaheme c-type cytochrome
MKSILIRLGLLALMISGLAGCGGGGSAAPANPGAIPSAAANPANDTSINASAPFTAMLDAGISPVVVSSGTPGTVKVNFSVFSDGAVVHGLTTSNARFALAKLVPGTNGDPDQWVNYVSTIETPTTFPGNTVGPSWNGDLAVLASAVQATTDSGGTLAENADGYYTYTFKADIQDPAWTLTNGGGKVYLTNGIVFEPNRTHRIAIQLSYKNAAGATVLVNPYFDFTIDGNGNAVAVTDPSKTRKMTDVASCNTCHDKLALHGGGRVDTQFCVMCHNSGTTDMNSGNVLDLRTMAHKLHSGRRLAQSTTPEDYVIWGYNASKVDFAEVGFPQDLRNCTKCHSGANASTPQGDNWKTKPTKEACLTCHQTGLNTTWDANHIVPGGAATTFLGNKASAAETSNLLCGVCHGIGSPYSPEQVHWNQNEEDAAKYKVVIDSATFTADGTGATKGSVAVVYHVDDTTNGNAKWDLTADCTGTCGSSNRFGNLRFIAGYNNIPGQSTSVTEFSSYNNNGSSASVYAARGDGVNDGNNVYTANIIIPADIPGVTEAKGTGRVITYGQIIEPELDVVTRVAKTDPVADNCQNKGASTPNCNLNVSAKNTFKDFAISGPVIPRRQIVASEKCNACHGTLGTTSGSNTLSNAFHGGARNTVEACGATCHDIGRGSTTLMNADFPFPATVLGGTATGYTMNESFQLKRMIHGIHGGEKKLKNPDGTYKYPFMHGTDNITAEVSYPGILSDCNTCHVNNSYQNDRGPLGAVVFSTSTSGSNANAALVPSLYVSGTSYVDPLKLPVISPKAASCTSCHDDPAKQVHMLTTSGFGGGVFGAATQGNILNPTASGGVTEICTTCHAPGTVFGSLKTGVDVAHGL